MNRICILQSSGLGNQMFIYGCGYALAKRNNMELYQDMSKYYFGITSSFFKLHNYNITYDNYRHLPFKKWPGNVIEWKIKRFFIKVLNHLNYKIIYEKEFMDYQDFDLSGNKDIWLSGFWQNSAYVSEYREDLKKEFTLKIISDRVTAMSSYVEKANICGIHVRLGDYLTFFGGSLDWSYYYEAMDMIREKNPSVRFLVFSDDIDTCKSQFGHIPYISFVPNGFSGQEEMHIMSHCNELIIANSSFSWWGAFLSNATRVICPLTEMWKSDYYLDEWEKIEAKMVPASEEGLKHMK